jgi:uncharacterized protein (DUF305 family)
MAGRHGRRPRECCDTKGEGVRRRLGSWLILVVLAAGCATPHASHQPTVNDQTDVWFAQHMVPHLLQDTSIAYLSRARLTDPELVRVANRIHRCDQLEAARLVEWLAERGLSPHGHSHQPGDHLRRSDLERLSQLDGVALDLAFVKVMTARDRAGAKLATTEAREGTVPAIRQLARQLLLKRQNRMATMQSWRRASSKPYTKPPPARTVRQPCFPSIETALDAVRCQAARVRRRP